MIRAVLAALLLAACAPAIPKDALAPPYDGQRPAPIEETASGYLKDLEAR